MKFTLQNSGEDGISLNGTPYETFQRRRRRGGRCFHYEGASVRHDTLTWRAYIKLHGNGQRYYTIEEYQRLPVLFWCLSGIL
ncbi:hypothetical protein V1478_007647 [Vespula squamosa]|uniref:Uncharacterized protein n=1 Tax=Vespula squamosa TaxID=30214 RepID=A0ABD2B3R8_VESSQ